MTKQTLINAGALGRLCLAAAFALSLWPSRAQEPARPAGNALAVNDWQAVAPGRVEPLSQRIRIGSGGVGQVAAILVKVNDTVFAEEALIRIDNSDIRTRLAKVEAEVNLRKRGRANPPLPNDVPRRKVEDAAADAEQAVAQARTARDQAAIARRAGTTGSEDALKAAGVALSGARGQLQLRQVELARFEASTTSIVPTELEGQLAAARIELRGAEAAVDNLTIRAPTAGTILQLGIRSGEMVSPSATQPLVVLGDLSALGVWAELDERDIGAITGGQPVVVRSAAFPGRDFSGKVSSIAPIIASGSFGARGQSGFTDIDVASVIVEVASPGPLLVGMKVDVYFRRVGP